MVSEHAVLRDSSAHCNMFAASSCNSVNVIVSATNVSGAVHVCFPDWQVSPRLQGFIDRMLVRDPSQRANAFELLQHPFLRNAGNYSCLVPLMRSFRHSPC